MLVPWEIEGWRQAAGLFIGSEDLDFRKAFAGIMQNSTQKVRECSDVDFLGGTVITWPRGGGGDCDCVRIAARLFIGGASTASTDPG